MSEWNSKQYLQFETQRTQPSRDLAKRVDNKPKYILDIGCGPGNSTAVLAEFFPDAKLTGIDSSPDMIARAREKHPTLSFALQDARTISGTYDLLFSNACLQWIENHEKLIPHLMQKLTPNGILAVQLPNNMDEPFYRVLDEMTKDEKWGFTEYETNDTLPPEDYFDILSACASRFAIWETVYYHAMPGVDALIEWVKGARLRPFLRQMNEAMQKSFEAELFQKTLPLYRPMKNGEIIFRFRRLFFIAYK